MQKIVPTSAFLILGMLALTAFSTAPARAEVSAAPRDTNLIIKDPRAFKCICYSGYRDGQAPGQSEPNEAQVREDLVLIEKHTHEIRTYGCGKGTHGYLIPKIADELGLTVHLGIWVDAKYSEDANLAAINDAIALVKEGHKSIKSVIVGNEFMFRVRNIDKLPAAPAEARLVNYVKLVKAGLPKSVLVTTADTWSDVEKNGDALLSQLDYVIWHTHPWWELQPIGSAVGYVAGRLKIMQDRVAKVGGKPLVLGETGWPSLATNGGAVGSPENQTRFFKELTTWGFNNSAEFWSFTAFDEKWKDAEGTVGGHWGFWYSNRQPLAIITGIATLYPKYMWSENPNLTTGLHPFAGILNSSVPSWSVHPSDVLGRSIGAFTFSSDGALHGRVFVRKNGSTALFISAP